MPYKCFLVAKSNVREVERRTCDKLHGDDDNCNDNAVVMDTIFDAVRLDTGEKLKEGISHMTLSGLVGAMWFEDYTEYNFPRDLQDWAHLSEEEMSQMRDRHNGQLPDRRPSFIFAPGPQLTVITPGGRWVIDSRASNCTMPFDYDHRCWIRHGEPPEITVDKNGQTCNAGAGSIQCGNYHGFLQNGSLTDG